MGLKARVLAFPYSGFPGVFCRQNKKTGTLPYSRVPVFIRFFVWFLPKGRILWPDLRYWRGQHTVSGSARCVLRIPFVRRCRIPRLPGFPSVWEYREFLPPRTPVFAEAVLRAESPVRFYKTMFPPTLTPTAVRSFWRMRGNGGRGRAFA